MSNVIVAWRVPDWHGDEWQELDPPLLWFEFGDHVGENDDDCEKEGTFCEGEVRLRNGSTKKFSVEKSYSVDYTAYVEGEAVTARDDGTPRQVRALTTIRTRGKHCDMHCVHRYDDECVLHGGRLRWSGRLWVRGPKCLALDEPELVSEEARSPDPGTELVLLTKSKNALVQALRRVRDEVEYAHNLHNAAYMADKHVTRALTEANEPEPDACSHAYVARRHKRP